MHNDNHDPDVTNETSRWITREDIEPDRSRLDEICLAAFLGAPPSSPPFGPETMYVFDLWTHARSHIGNEARYGAHELRAVRVDTAGITWVKLVDPTRGPARELVVPLTDRAAQAGRGRRVGATGHERLRTAKMRAFRSLASFWHPPFSERGREGLNKLQVALRNVLPRSVDEWEDAFRKTLLIRTHMARWDLTAQAYTRFASGPQLTAEQRREIFRVVIWAVAPDDPAVALEGTRFYTLARPQIEEIYDFVKHNRTLTLPGLAD